MKDRSRGLRRWFLVSGCLGVIVALALLVMGASHIVSPTLLLVLWPASIAGIADPSTLSDKILVALFEFGGNFVLYGVIGMLVGLCFRRRTSQPMVTTP
jgi:predicted cobalt transporter CbtA